MELHEEYLNILHENVVEICFIKKNGDPRLMLCTLREDLLPIRTSAAEESEKAEPNVDDDIINVWDIDKAAWRSFHTGDLLSFEVSE